MPLKRGWDMELAWKNVEAMKRMDEQMEEQQA
jgi:hypothetical protein